MAANTHISPDNQLTGFGLHRFHSVAELMEAAKRYPYSLPVQALLAKALKQSQNFDYEKFIKVSAVLSPDRQWLYNFIHTELLPEKAENPAGVAELNTVTETEPVVVQHQPIIVPESEEAPVKEELIIEEPIIFQMPLEVELEDVQLPMHEPVLADDSAEIMDQALKNVKWTEPVIEEPVKEEPAKMEPVRVEQPVAKKPVVEEPVKPVDEMPVVKSAPVTDLLEREILKEAIDKTIQQEVSEIQPDFAVVPEEETKEDEPAPGFQFWLNPASKKVETRAEKLRKIDALIEKFIKSEPRIVPKKAEFFSPANAAKQSVVLNEDVVSEPLALIFEKQGYFDKAIKAYEKLSLKIPEKRAYFATRIEKIKEIVKNIKNNRE